MRRQRGIKLAVAIFMAIAIALFLPGLGTAGSLEPSGPPEPTMKTLDQIPPTWDQTLQCDTTACPRFVLVMGGAGVLDKETGLVWEQSPSTTSVGEFDAYNRCNQLTTGGRLGWRLPTAKELASLLDPAQSNPALPLGHPFSNVQLQSPAWYWSASRDTQYYSSAGVFSSLSTVWFVDFADALVGLRSRNTSAFVWCVRGAHSTDLLIH